MDRIIRDKIDLYKQYGLDRKGAKGGFLSVFSPASDEEIKPKLRPCVLVIAGGGYAFLSHREKEPIALAFAAKGYVAAMLDYSIFASYPAPLIEACAATIYLRENAKALGINVDQVCAIGFSAGGHLTGMLGTVKPDELKVFGAKAKLAKPNAVILSYPVALINMTDSTHGGSRDIIAGLSKDAVKTCDGDIDLDKLSVEKRVDADSAPAFIWHCAYDNCVAVANSVQTFNAYQALGIPVEMHIFSGGWHGMSLVTEEVSDELPPPDIAYVAEWFDLCITWLKQTRGFCVKTVY